MSNETPNMTKPHMGAFKQWYPGKYELTSRGLGIRIHGTFHGHPIYNKTHGYSSEIIALFPELNMIETRNSRYTLEEPSLAEGMPLINKLLDKC